MTNKKEKVRVQYLIVHWIFVLRIYWDAAKMKPSCRHRNDFDRIFIITSVITNIDKIASLQ